MLAPITDSVALNGICPYFTMFPLSFPLRILKGRAVEGQSVLDPFCGRGTTNFAARLVGLRSIGIDSSPVAAAIAAAKLVGPSADRILAEARTILGGTQAREIPAGEFWERAFHKSVLAALSQFREAFLSNCESEERVALRAILLGALHGPQRRSVDSYLSNQCPRTYAPKPGYALRYWRSRGLEPRAVEVDSLIKRKAERYYSGSWKESGAIRLGDSRIASSVRAESDDARFEWVITSPPYYGMRTYVPDQWLRNWFLGGPESVQYAIGNQLTHSSPDEFASDLKRVWLNVAAACTDSATLVIRFGGIPDRNVDPLDLIKASLQHSGWTISTARAAGTASEGKRQADAFLRSKSKPMAEYDVWAKRSDRTKVDRSAVLSTHSTNSHRFASKC